jgi:hypothetical protein
VLVVLRLGQGLLKVTTAQIVLFLELVYPLQQLAVVVEQLVLVAEQATVLLVALVAAVQI